MNFEHPSAEETPESEARRETIRQEHEYRDLEGKLLGKAIIELDAEVRVEPRFQGYEDRTPTFRVLKSFVLVGEKDGISTEIDVLKLANPHGVEVLVETARRQATYAYDDAYGQGKASVPPLENPIDVGVALHELGHADQHHDERFKYIVPLYSWKWGAYNQMPDLKLTLQAVPEAAELFDAEELKQLHELERRYKAAEEQSAPDRQQLLEAWYELMELMEIDKVKYLPRNIMERDATRRAFQWLHTIREKTGIDLLSKDVKVRPDVTMGFGRPCEESIASEGPDVVDWSKRRLIANTIGSLKDSLSTYSAKVFRKKKPGQDDDIGIMPAAGGKRKM